MEGPSRIALVSEIGRTAEQYYHVRGTEHLARPIEHHLKTLLQGMRLADVGLGEQEVVGLVEAGKTYSLNIYESSKFCLAIFILGPGARIPLHDHPDITVITKVLYGAVQITSLDWVERPKSLAFPPLAQHPAVVKSNIQMHPSTPPRLISEGNCNIHEIFAPELAIVFDVQLPPYSDEDEKDCHYFQLGLLTEAGSNSSVSTDHPDGSHPSHPHAGNRGSYAAITTTTTTTTTSSSSEVITVASGTMMSTTSTTTITTTLGDFHFPKITFTLPKPASSLIAPLAFLKPQMRVVLQKVEPDLPGDEWKYVGPQVDESIF